jgi:hypothetical protein
VRPGDGAPLLRQGDGGGFAAAARWQIRPHPSGCCPQLVRPPHAPATPTPAPRHCLRTKVSRQQFFLTINNRF